MMPGIIRAVAFLLFLYLSWRNLRDNFKDEDLISYGWWSVMSFLIGSRMVWGLLNWGSLDGFGDWFLVWQIPGSSNIGGYLVWLAMSVVWAIKKEWKFWPLMEDMTFNILWLIMLLSLDELVRSNFDLNSLVDLSIIFLGYVGAVTIKKKYRSFSWYKSGKKGFVFLFANILIFISLALVSGLLRSEMIKMYLCLGIVLGSIFQLLALGEVLAGVNIYAKKSR